MTAVSKSFVVIADGAVDPASPLDTVLLTGLRDSIVNLDERLGGGDFLGRRRTTRTMAPIPLRFASGRT